MNSDEDVEKAVSDGRIAARYLCGEYAIHRFNQLQQERRLLREALARETDLVRRMEMQNRIGQISGEINDLRLAWGITLPNL